MRKDIEHLKQAAKMELKRAENDWIKNMTDEELQEKLNRELAELGFKSEEEFNDAAKKFTLENDPDANVTHDYAVNKRIFELFKDFRMFEEFMLKYSSVEWTE
jgi:hypothetical protein